MKAKIILSIVALMLISGASGQINTVIDSLELDLKVAKEDTVKVKSLNSLSDQYSDIGDFEKAMQYAESALALAERFNRSMAIFINANEALSILQNSLTCFTPICAL